MWLSCQSIIVLYKFFVIQAIIGKGELILIIQYATTSIRKRIDRVSVQGGLFVSIIWRVSILFKWRTSRRKEFTCIRTITTVVDILGSFQAWLVIIHLFRERSTFFTLVNLQLYWRAATKPLQLLPYWSYYLLLTSLLTTGCCCRVAQGYRVLMY